MKKAAVFSGGATKGSYTSGALRYLLSDLNIQYDIICGSSVGALLTAFLGMFKHGQEIEASKALENLWLDMSQDKIYKKWNFFGKIAGLWRESLFDCSPLHKFIRSNISLEAIRKSGKILRVGAVSLTSSQFRTFKQDEDCFLDAILASSAYPGIFKPVEIDGELWADAGIKQITPIKTAIDLGADQIDVIITSPEKNTKVFTSKPTSIETILRAVELMTDEIMKNDIEMALMYNKLVLAGDAPDKRYVKINIIRPNFVLTQNSMDFCKDNIKKMMKIGYEDAKKQYPNQF